jgi:hypothetical protein
VDETVKTNRIFLIVVVALAALPLRAQGPTSIIDASGHVRAGRESDLADPMKPPLIIDSTSADRHWIFCHRHYGSHASVNSLYRSEVGLKFVPVLKDFDKAAWKFFCKTEGFPEKEVQLVYPAEFVEWNADGSRLLFELTSGLGHTLQVTTPLYKCDITTIRVGITIRAALHCQSYEKTSREI